MKENRTRYGCIALIGGFLCAVQLFLWLSSSGKGAELLRKISPAWSAGTENPVIVIDAGHGGQDPGKIGVNGAQEKDINLAVAQELKELLEQNDITVIMTRTGDDGLYRAEDRNKKSADMRARVALIEEIKPVLAVSIHQNSFTDEKSRGAQVFYYEHSVEGKSLALTLQEAVKRELADGNHRVAKPNTSYYMLKKSACPLVIAECGFLSNPAEADLLVREDYQRKLAFAIHLGILEWLSVRDETETGRKTNHRARSTCCIVAACPFSFR